MLPMDARKNSESYAFPNGMLNAAYIAGVLRKPSEGHCFIQQSPNENHMLPIEFDPKKNPIPNGMKEMDLIFAICHMSGRREDDKRIVVARSIAFTRPNIMHIGDRGADALVSQWKKAVHANAKGTDTPEAIKTIQASHPNAGAEKLVQSAVDFRVLGLNRNSTNTVQLAGFVNARHLESNRKGPDGQSLADRLTILLRQNRDSDRCIAVRMYSKRSLEALYKKIRRGLPILVHGEYRIDAKAIGDPDPETGIAPVVSIPYILAKDFPSLVHPGDGNIRIIPTWAQELYEGVTPAAALVAESEPLQEVPEISDEERSSLFAAAMSNQ